MPWNALTSSEDDENYLKDRGPANWQACHVWSSRSTGAL